MLKKFNYLRTVYYKLALSDCKLSFAYSGRSDEKSLLEWKKPQLAETKVENGKCYLLEWYASVQKEPN